MCSKRWANPVRPGASFLEPTWYQALLATIGVEWSSCSRTVRPFFNLYSLTLIGGSLSADCATSDITSDRPTKMPIKDLLKFISSSLLNCGLEERLRRSATYLTAPRYEPNAL